MPIAYIDKINQRPIGAEQLIVNEAHIIGITAIATVTPNYIRLIEVPLLESPSSVAIPGYTEVTTTPGTNEFKVDYTNGRILFHSSKNGNTVFVTYKGRGSLIDAEDVNELQQVFVGSVTPGSPTIGIANLDGTLSDGIVRPNNISTIVADDFTFPGDVIVTGDLDVKGAVTYIESTVVRIEDPIIQLNYSQPVGDSGIEVRRDTNPPVKLIWNETDDAWELRNTADVAILKARDTGDVSILDDLIITGKTYLSNGTVSAPSLTFTSDTNTGIYTPAADYLYLVTGGSGRLAIGNSSVVANVPIQIQDGSAASPSLSFSGDPTTGIYKPALNVLGITTAGVEAIRINSSQNVGLGVSPAAKLHIGGSTIFGLTTATNPASIPTATVDANSGIVITTTGVVSVTIGSPTNTTQGRFFTVLHNDTSSGTLSVNTQSIGLGKGATFIWDGTAWIPVGGAGGFNLVVGDPGSPQQGDTWFDTVTNQFKGYNGINIVLLG